MTDASRGPGWWMASDGKWYPPHLHPSAGSSFSSLGDSIGEPKAVKFSNIYNQDETNRLPSASPNLANEDVPVRRGPAKYSFLLAGFSIRVLAYLADAVVLAFIIWVVLGIELMVSGNKLIGYGLVFCIYLWYAVWQIGVHGQTIAMRWFHIYVADQATGTYPIGLGRAFIRAFVAALFAVVPFGALIDLCWAIWDPRTQTLHDKVVSTVVPRRN